MTLPTPAEAFYWSAEPWGHALRCRPLAAVAQHAFTSKELQLRPSLPSGHGDGGAARRARQAADDSYALAWTQAAASVGAGLEQLRRVKQVHGKSVRVLRGARAAGAEGITPPEGDAIVSDAHGLVLTVQVADCVPILLADADHRAAAAVHAGWRGTAANVAQAAVDAMVRAFATTPAKLIAAIGPSIGPCCYEVGAAVRAAFTEQGAGDEQLQRWFQEADGVIRLDLWRANRDQLQAAGIASDRIYVAGLCTKTHNHVFHSYRVEGERAGRMAALIAVPN